MVVGEFLHLTTTGSKSLGAVHPGRWGCRVEVGGIRNPGRNQDGLGMVCGCFVVFRVANV